VDNHNPETVYLPSNLPWIHFLTSSMCFGHRLRYGEGLMALAGGAWECHHSVIVLNNANTLPWVGVHDLQMPMSRTLASPAYQ
jgi:hypothetical protein